MQNDTAAEELVAFDVAVGVAPGDSHVTVECAYFSRRITTDSARVLAMALIRAAEHIEGWNPHGFNAELADSLERVAAKIRNRAAPQLADVPAAKDRVM